MYGTVVVIDADGLPKSGVIQSDGRYRVSGVKRGAARAAVSSPPPPGAEPPASRFRKWDEDSVKLPPVTAPVDPELVKNWFPIPERYGDPDKSQIRTEVKSGGPFDIDLK